MDTMTMEVGRLAERPFHIRFYPGACGDLLMLYLYSEKETHHARHPLTARD